MQADTNLGRKLVNRYQLIRPLGQGSMGRVYAAKDLTLGGVMVAVKFLAQTLLNRQMRERFEREAQTCAILGQRNIHIVRVTDYGIDDRKVPFYVMEHLIGQSLADLIRYNPLPVPQFLETSRQTCLGLQRAHQGIEIDGSTFPVIHRDIKPSNIFIAENDTLGKLVKVLDFGIAKLRQADAQQQTDCFMGTLAYASPEQMEGQNLDQRSDIYSLGVMMFQMLTGKLPLQPANNNFGGWYQAHRKVRPLSVDAARPGIRIPKELDTLLMSCIAKSPHQRPQHVSEILEQLEPIIKQAATYPPDVPPQAPIEDVSSPIEAVCRRATWPQNKPKAEIVFPQLMKVKNELFVTLWVMLPHKDIERIAAAIPYNKFMFLASPHPVLLWATVLYNHEHAPRWLPCYLDLKATHGQQILRVLSKTRHYRMLCFDLEKAEKCSYVKLLTITEPSVLVKPELLDTQAKRLSEFSIMGHAAPASDFGLSKSILKAELEKLKPSIAQKLEAIR
ncbi:MAG: serine/threonine protein kinase [Elainellaceae cyanobacterium]